MPEFTLFPKFPPELRHRIWHLAIATPWSYTRFRRKDRRIKLLGRIDRAASQACRESRAITRLTHTYLEPHGWINLDRHLFFFRDVKYDRDLIAQVQTRFGLLEKARHVVIQPRDWSPLGKTLDLLKKHCVELRTLVVVMPWEEPPGPPYPDDFFDYALEFYCGTIFRESPTEIENMESLLDAIDKGPEVGAEEMKQYIARLDDMVLANAAGEYAFEDSLWYLLRRDAVGMQVLGDEFPQTKPAVYLRDRRAFCAPDLLPYAPPGTY